MSARLAINMVALFFINLPNSHLSSAGDELGAEEKKSSLLPLLAITGVEGEAPPPHSQPPLLHRGEEATPPLRQPPLLQRGEEAPPPHSQPPLLRTSTDLTSNKESPRRRLTLSVSYAYPPKDTPSPITTQTAPVTPAVSIYTAIVGLRAQSRALSVGDFQEGSARDGS